ncbi:hypothetical protein F5Y04DRAFT_281712 [Hypomontagnella monticulosa]|nr:hypothetical protein F5Y04DRAFT_281712 [Hypomontagnella monticulosa]
MAYYQQQSCFFRLPLELRDEIYTDVCQHAYDSMKGVLLRDIEVPDYRSLLRHDFSGKPALLLTCKRVEEEANRCMNQDISIVCRDYFHCEGCSLCRSEPDNADGVQGHLLVRAIGKIDSRRIKRVSLACVQSFCSYRGEPRTLLDLLEHIINTAPTFRELTLRWNQDFHGPFYSTTLRDTTLVNGWFPILAKAKNLKTLTLSGVERERTGTFVKDLAEQNPDLRVQFGEVYLIAENIFMA